jgi:plasmid stabilization system protein ParE
VRRFRVIIASAARDEIAEAVTYLSNQASPDAAARWLDELEQLLASLGEMPERFPVAPDDRYFPQGTLRHAIHHSHRVLFTLRGDSVLVLHLRHAMRDTLKDI